MTAGWLPYLLLSVPVWPLLIAMALAIPALRPGALRLVPLAALPALLTALLPSTELEFELPWMLLGSVFGLDDVSSVYLLFSALLWTAGGLSLPDTGRSRFSVWFLVTMAGNFAVLLARDIPSFYLAFAVMSLSAFGLVIHTRTAAAQRAARVYLVFAVLGEVVVLFALILFAHYTGTQELAQVTDRAPPHVVLALLMIGFGIKAGVPLLHLALPPAYAATPLPGAVPMAGALLHVGLYGWMRFLPLGQVAVPEWSMVFIGAGTLAVLYGSVVGLTQREARSLLAYSSMGQMGLMMLGVGIGLGSPDHWPVIQPALLLFALHHALTKGALFHGLGIRGRARIGLWLPALALAGMPLTGGALAKGAIKAQVHLMPDAWSALGPWVLVAGSVGTTLLMGRFLYLSLGEEPHREVTSAASWWLLLVALSVLPWIWPLPIERLSPLWEAFWPILPAAVLAWLVYKGAFARLLSGVPAVPPGDLLILAEGVVQRIPRPHDTHPEHKKEYGGVLQPRAVPVTLAVPERFLAQWWVAVSLLLCLVLGLFFLLLT